MSAIPTRRRPGRMRVRPWQGDARVAHVTPALDHLGPLTVDDVERTLEDLRRRGYRSVVTAALRAPDRGPFLAAGFAEAAHLHLLLHDLDDLPAASRPPGIGIRRARRGDQARVLAVDRAAFAPFWRLDEAGLAEALSATASVHFQVARDAGGDVVGYAVCGRTGPNGYVQRLAVAPEHQGRGVGAALLVDGLRWLRRWGARDALVNTQEDNARSLRLYQRLGFVVQAEDLAVLQRDLVDDGAGDAAGGPRAAELGRAWPAPPEPR
ncbi:MAG TPA: GNAT family N-acetyltransferase [Acidimicrobiales bacterium]|nr:GNAT family N-acetyltransferase [Acidimicrobiales bacterium]